MSPMRIIATHTKVEVDELPPCVFVQTNRHLATPNTKAKYDARLNKLGNSAWASVCEDCFEFFGCELGLGKGQEYVLKGGDAITTSGKGSDDIVDD
jgi:hypothetical protein